MFFFDQISKSVGICSVFKPGNASWLGGPFGSSGDSFSTEKKAHTRRIKADTFDFNNNLKIF
ncbi:MAG: hypothetical protein C4522_18640 [Desulfobacteraceae bacterium]|nr:MAG: hypothetical protein C4522_18640 [Desulfobacteraceae bacterium]